jgi:phosphoribosyl-AMP cyclohydrolase
VEQIGAACHTGTHTCFDGRGIDVTGLIDPAGTGRAGTGQAER